MPLLYLAAAHLCLLAAFVIVAIDARRVAGFYYHPRLVAVVHLVTLGWISSSILGALYIIGPLAFRIRLPAGRGDYVALASFAIGVMGMISHFWMDSLSGMAWSAALVVGALVFVGGRVLRGLRHAPVPLQARLPVALAILNMFTAACVGILLGIHKTHPFLPCSQLEGVLGHAHLAALGWATLMVMGAGYRMLPMLLPAAMPSGAGPYVATALTQVGAWGLFLAFLFRPHAVAFFAMVAAAGIATFLSQVVWMLRHRRPAPSERPRPDLSIGHAMQAIVYLLAATLVGVGLAFAAPSEATLRWVMAYGTFGLLGFLSQIIVGVSGRILPLHGWLWGFADRGHQETPPSLHRAPSRELQWSVLVLWSIGVPALAAGLAFDWLGVVQSAAAALGTAVALGGANVACVLRRLWAREI